jgi:hypothetical protein
LIELLRVVNVLHQDAEDTHKEKPAYTESRRLSHKMITIRPTLGSIITLSLILWAHLSLLQILETGAVPDSLLGAPLSLKTNPDSNSHLVVRQDKPNPLSYRVNRRNKRSLTDDDVIVDLVDDPYEQYDLFKGDDEKKKWASGKNMAVWGKRDVDDVTNDDVEKRKWTGNNMAVWGKKRKWSSGKMAGWGQRGGFGEAAAGRRWIEGMPIEEEKRKWSGKNMAVWGK